MKSLKHFTITSKEWFLTFGCFYIFQKKKSAKPYVEMGTQQKSDVDVDWLPKETTTEFGKILYDVKLVKCGDGTKNTAR